MVSKRLIWDGSIFVRQRLNRKIENLFRDASEQTRAHKNNEGC